MRLAAIDGRACLVVPGGVVELGASGHPDDPMACLARWEELSTWAAATDPAPTAPLEEARLTCPVPRPTQVFAIGLNYRAHCEETGAEVPTVPLTFTKFPSCLAGPRDDVVLVPGSVDWEVELVLVVGAGCTVGQDLSERQLQKAGRPPQFSLAKSHRGFGPVGPWVTDEVDPGDLAISCALNGEVVQASRTSDMVFGPAELLAHLGGVCDLRPGDLVFTGTPSGVGMGRTPPRFLQPGDVLVSTIEHVGTMVNRCRIEEPTVAPV
ncbi:MAG TPA: fumarylacetoacetate hydrolase family protein [Acidimicrobiales bacterium]|nr:fumarylacetoacetate hydrolase family protein [Acidimicrobiales bacterium]